MQTILVNTKFSQSTGCMLTCNMSDTYMCIYWCPSIAGLVYGKAHGIANVLQQKKCPYGKIENKY